jgi:ABC-type spermidine/putrescine transport system permease subunit I
MDSNNLADEGTAVPREARRTALTFARQHVAPFVGPLFLLMVIGFDIPVLLIFGYSIASRHGLTLENYEALATSEVLLKVIGNTVRITIATTVVVAVLGYILSYWISLLTPRRRNIALALVILPFWVSVLVRTYAWIVVLGNARAGESFAAVDGVDRQSHQLSLQRPRRCHRHVEHSDAAARLATVCRDDPN